MKTTKNLLLTAATATALLLAALTGCDQSSADCDKDPGAWGCECSPTDTAKACNTGLVCDPVAEICRLPLSCVTLGCQPHQLCGLGDTDEATCLDECEAGYEWDANGEKCVLHPPTCAPGLPNSIDESCAAQLRVCEQPLHDAAAWCGDCLEGYVDAAGICREKRTCDDLGTLCQKQQRPCLAGEPNQDAYCAPDCPPGSTPATDNVCECAEHYAMDMSDPLGFSCEPVLRCPEAGGVCPAGFECVSCKTDEACVKAKGDQPASCIPTDCDGPYLWSDVLQGCVECPSCAAMGAGSKGVPMLTEDQLQCLCQTEPGYFFSFAGEIGIHPCDADGDGWVRESARASVESKDAALSAQARCSVGRIEAVVLQNDWGQTISPESFGAEGVMLYESDRNDDDGLLAQTLIDAGLNKGYGAFDATTWSNPTAPAPTRVHARQLNRFTRLCHLPTADYNDNGVADVAEWQDQKVDDPPFPDLPHFNQYSYFAELHDGLFGVWDGSTFTPGTIGTGGFPATPLTPPKVYAWAVVERPRDASSFPLRHGAGVAPPKCHRRPDTTADLYYSKAGMDFVAQDYDWSEGWEGMTHSSQFKCVLVQSQAGSTSQNVLSTNYDTKDWAINACQLTNAGAGPGAGGVVLGSCNLQPAVKVGQVRWAVAAFKPNHEEPGEDGYVRGCVDQCGEIRRAAASNQAGQSTAALGDLPFKIGGAIPCNLTAGHASGVACDANPANGEIQCRESCTDGVDNDGDGAVNEIPDAVFQSLANTNVTNDGSLVTGKAACATGLAGECANGGVACDTVTGAAACVADVGIEGTDFCNGKDDDCDGDIDEDAALVAVSTPGLPYSNAKAGDPCSSQLVGACAAGGGAWSCLDSGSMSCVPNTQPAAQEQCNGIDEDCDGIADTAETTLFSALGYTVGGACGMVGGIMQGPQFLQSGLKGECAKGGTMMCTASGWRCNQGKTAATEKCNGKDDDCNGTIDDWDGNGIKGAACKCKSYVGALGFGGTLYISQTPSAQGWDPQLNTSGTFSGADQFNSVLGGTLDGHDNETLWQPMEHIIDVGITPPSTPLSSFDNLSMGISFTLEVHEKNETGTSFDSDSNTFWKWSSTVSNVAVSSNTQAQGFAGTYQWGSHDDQGYFFAYNFEGENGGIRSCDSVIGELKAAGVNPAQTTLQLEPGTATAGAPANTYRLRTVHRIWGTTDEHKHKDTGWIRDKNKLAVFDLTGSVNGNTTRRGFDFVDSTAGSGYAHATHWHIPNSDPNLGAFAKKVSGHYWGVEGLDKYYNLYPGSGGNGNYPYGIYHYIKAIPGDKDFFQRVLVMPGWGPNGNDHHATMTRTWIRVPFMFTPPDAP